MNPAKFALVNDEWPIGTGAFATGDRRYTNDANVAGAIFATVNHPECLANKRANTHLVADWFVSNYFDNHKSSLPPAFYGSSLADANSQRIFGEFVAGGSEQVRH